MVYRGPVIFTFPGIHVPSMCRPSGGVMRVPMVKAAGIRRMDSLMKALRIGSFASVEMSDKSPTSLISLKTRSA